MDTLYLEYAVNAFHSAVLPSLGNPKMSGTFHGKSSMMSQAAWAIADGHLFETL